MRCCGRRPCVWRADSGLRSTRHLDQLAHELAQLGIVRLQLERGQVRGGGLGKALLGEQEIAEATRRIIDAHRALILVGAPQLGTDLRVS